MGSAGVRRGSASGWILAIAVLIGSGSVGLAEAETAATDATVTVPLAPVRILDTRNGIGAPHAPLGADESLDLQVTGVAGVPVGAVGVLLNITADGASETTYLTAWPAGEARPDASVLNAVPGQALPNFIEAKLGAGGKLSIYNFAGSVNVIADVAGYQVPVGGVSGLPGGGPQGPQGLPGPQGPAGTTGAQGPRGWSAWDAIPSGITVTGSANWSTPTMVGVDRNAESISLPGVPPVALTTATIGFYPLFTTQLAAGEIDPACNVLGSDGFPVAPPGRLCLVVAGASSSADDIGADALFGGAGLTVGWSAAAPPQSTAVTIRWAYTAP